MALGKKFDEAFNNNDAAAVAALFTEDAIWVVDTGAIRSTGYRETGCRVVQGGACQQPYG